MLKEQEEDSESRSHQSSDTSANLTDRLNTSIPFHRSPGVQDGVKCPPYTEEVVLDHNLSPLDLNTTETETIDSFDDDLR